MSKELPSREQAILLLQKYNSPPKVIRHCEEVAALALEIAGKIESKGIKVNMRLVEAGALLHDIGRSKSHAVDHGLLGSEIAESEHLPESLVRIIRRHVGGGITTEEAEDSAGQKTYTCPKLWRKNSFRTPTNLSTNPNGFL